MPTLSNQTLSRLPLYLNYLKLLDFSETPTISAAEIARSLGLNPVLVRKDLALISSGGRPKVGHPTETLYMDIQHYLSCDEPVLAVLVGAGNLGSALMAYDGFKGYGIDIFCAFDADPSLAGRMIKGRPILDIRKMPDFCLKNQIRIGIITVPATYAQQICDALVDCGVSAIWNFAPIHLKVPPHVLVQNENMACALALLSKHLSAASPAPANPLRENAL